MKAFIKPIVFLLCLLPATYLFYAVFLAYTGGENLLGPDPAPYLSLQTGSWAIRLLILSLAITPLRYLFQLPYLWRFRRMIGLYALFYTFLHFLVFIMFLLQWQWREIIVEIIERQFIVFGLVAFVLMLLLGMTSFNAAQRKLGRNWKRLHKLTYAINILAVLHVVWVIRSSIADALLYSSLVFLFLGYRVLRHYSLSVRRFSLRK